ncbi:MAG TPA: hypothetical protein VFH59_11465 [Frateuria sp.]|uniref:hypothetical protein n=1 Tax=Frateuria sp. TaxID=2211372 RepID=UPI002D80BBD1|nr:hypothetical protein [Frateuria sp.]HET6806047.1 hypothetical protein [Frateuria sp.]
MRLSSLSLLIVLLAVPSLTRAQDYKPLSQRMTAAEFKAAGLDRLSPEQLQALDGWLRAHDKPTTRVVDASGKPVFYTDAHKRKLIESHLSGEFQGWNGHNVVTLDNGQQWKQIGSDAVQCNSSNHAAVKVRPSMIGGWLLYVEGCNGSVHAERVR